MHHPKLGTDIAVMAGAATSEMSVIVVNPPPPLSESEAAVKVQKVYRSHRERCELADSNLPTDRDLWWQTIYHAKLDHSTTSFFNSPKQESATCRWNRVGSHASKVGKGLSKDPAAQKLFIGHWIEAIDPRHRYGMSLYLYYEEWAKANSTQPFFYWLDIGDGKNVDLEACPRSKLQQQCVKYLGPREREQYEYVIVEGKLTHKLSGELMDTNQRKWIFVMSTCKKLYSAEKIRGKFHHSSFLAGGVTIASGILVVENGVPKIIFPHSGHYRPLEDNIETFLCFLKDNGLNLENVEVGKVSDSPYFSGSMGGRSTGETSTNLQPPNNEISVEEKHHPHATSGPREANPSEAKTENNVSSLGGLPSQL